MQFEVLQLPFRMRQFPSGLLVVQSLYMDDERAAQRVLDRIKEQGGHITSLRLAELENYALAVATEHLMVRVSHPIHIMVFLTLYVVCTDRRTKGTCLSRSRTQWIDIL